MLPPYLKAYFWYKTVLSVNNTFQQKRGSKILEKCRTLYTTRCGRIPTNNKVQQAMQNILNFYEDFSFLIDENCQLQEDINPPQSNPDEGIKRLFLHDKFSYIICLIYYKYITTFHRGQKWPWKFPSSTYLQFSESESKLFGGGPMCPRTTSATLLQIFR